MLAQQHVRGLSNQAHLRRKAGKGKTGVYHVEGKDALRRHTDRHLGAHHDVRAVWRRVQRYGNASFVRPLLPHVRRQREHGVQALEHLHVQRRVVRRQL